MFWVKHVVSMASSRNWVDDLWMKALCLKLHITNDFSFQQHDFFCGVWGDKKLWLMPFFVKNFSNTWFLNSVSFSLWNFLTGFVVVIQHSSQNLSSFMRSQIFLRKKTHVNLENSSMITNYIFITTYTPNWRWSAQINMK